IGVFKISLVSPRLGVSAFKPYDIVIETNRRAVCRYSFQANFDYISFDMKQFPISDMFLHNISSYDRESNIYIKCNDTYKSEINSAQYALRIDMTPPLITDLYADPSPINQPTGGQIRTTIFAETDEQAVCTYTFNKTTAYFAEENRSLSYTYNTSHQAHITLPSDGTFTYMVNCSNMADLSSARTLAIESNIFVGLTITFNKPKDNSATTEQELELNISTNKNAVCNFGSSSTGITENFEWNNSRNHFSSLGNLSEGKYNYYVRCSVLVDGIPSGEDRISSVTFTIDMTPPTMLYVNASEPLLLNVSGKTCFKNQLYSSWSAEDNESAVDSYAYSIFNVFSSAIIRNWTISNTNYVRALNLNLSDGDSYRFSVKAKNKAGLWSNELASNSITVDESLCPTAPTCRDGKKNGNETDVDCGDQCQKCAEQKTCRANSDCSTNKCIDNKCATELCSNNFIDEGEADVDCGGTCGKCTENKVCQKNSDCASNYCENNRCRTPSCADNKKNGRETDVDCGGGICPECDNNLACEQNSDCKSLSCLPVALESEESESREAKKICSYSCSDGIRNNDETGIDCGGSCVNEGKLCPEDQNCNQDSDCASGFCSQNLCVDKSKKDTDNDGMPDNWETENNLNPNDPSDAEKDNDKDRLANLREYLLINEKYGKSTNPNSKDTDKDGWSDYAEVQKGTDPTDSKSKPKSNLLLILIIIAGIILLAAIAVYLSRYFAKKKPKIGLPEEKYKAVQQVPGIVTAGRIQIPEEMREMQRQKLFEEKKKEREKERREIFKAFEEEKPVVVAPAEAEKISGLKTEEGWIAVGKLREFLKSKKPSEEKKPAETGKTAELGTELRVKKSEKKFKQEGKEKFETTAVQKKKPFEKLEELREFSREKKKEKTKEKERKEEKSRAGKKIEKLRKATHVSEQDVFEKLRQLRQSSISKKHEKGVEPLIELVAKKVEKHSLTDLLREMSSEISSEKFISVLKEILKYFVDRKKISRKEAVEILDDLRKKNIITKKEMSDVMFKLDE
ncbi:MAG TPA: hypothetical protein VI894_00725, partial [Candidatus Nanoarchaeia archaeon]|nr:hypothetical protein [Candidatus Nanoarchaeia archaeon]